MRRVAFVLVLVACAALPVACSDGGGSPPDVDIADPIVLTRGAAETPAVALLFEIRAGDISPGAVADILATLRERRVRPSFAITGRWAEANVALTRAIAADGHLIVNAGYDGTSFTGQSTGLRSLSVEQRALQLSRAEASIYRITNRTTQPFFRPPLGDSDPSVERDAAAAGYPVLVAGSLDARQAVDVPALLTRTSRASAGEIIVLSTSSSSPTASALEQVIDQLEAAGLEVASLEAFVPTP